MGKQSTFAEQQDISRASRAGTKAQHKSRPKTQATRRRSQTHHPEAHSNSAHLVKVAADFHKLLESCLDDPQVETVHHVRTGSRRVQAMIETILRQTGAGKRSLEVPGNAWLRQLKKIRGAAGPVRDLDVQRKLLEEALQPAEKARNGQPEHDVVLPAAEAGSTSSGGPESHNFQFAKQIQRMETWLKEQRNDRAQALHRQIKKRQSKLQERQSAFLAVAARAHRGVRAHRPAAIVALEDFVRIVDSLPVLDTANLHDFRKMTKKARYVAESGENDAQAQTIAKALKRVQDAIGDWHDWHCLTEEARTELKDDGSQLTAWLEEQTERSLHEALKTTERVRAKLVGEWLAIKRELRARGRSTRRPSVRISAESHEKKAENLTSGAA